MARKELKFADKYGSTSTGYKLSLREIEKVLTAHGLGMLRNGGCSWRDDYGSKPTSGCIMQIVDNIPSRFDAASANCAVACWFDQNYRSSWTPEEFIEAMQKAGIF